MKKSAMLRCQSIKKEFGEFLKSERKKAGISQLCLAYELGLSNAQLISNIERGICLLPAKHVPTISKTLMINQSELKNRIMSIQEAKIQTDIDENG